MRIKLLFIALLANLFFVNAQEAPVIDGDLLMCPWTDGTATVTNGETYATYQWYYKYWFLSGDFEAIAGATSETFVYDWYTYDQALFKLIVTKNGQTYESNTIQVDSYAWVSLSVIQEYSENVVFDPDSLSYLMCDGDTIVNTVTSPYSIVQWYKDGEAIEGATSTSYTITEPGSYYVVAAPDFCPNSTSTSMSIDVTANPDCSLSTDTPELSSLSIKTNPVKNVLSLNNGGHITIDNASIYTMSGQKIGNFEVINNQDISVENLATGMYILQITADNTVANLKFVKQ